MQVRVFRFLRRQQRFVRFAQEDKRNNKLFNRKQEQRSKDAKLYSNVK